MSFTVINKSLAGEAPSTAVPGIKMVLLIAKPSPGLEMITLYPPNFKHFINKLKTQHNFRVNKQTLRENAIDLILNKNN